MRASNLPRLARTAAQLHPGQAAQRARLRAQRGALEHQLPLARRWLLAGPRPAAAAGWPAAFTPLDAALWRSWPGRSALAAGELDLLGETRVLAPPGRSGAADWDRADWTMAGAPLLWRFHLYYWDWAWGLADADGRAAFTPVWQSWAASVQPGCGPAWQPYPAAVRAWSLCGLYASVVKGGPAEDEVLRELAALTGFLRRSLEADVGGNHLIKNLKALAGLAVFFADDTLLRRTLARLRRQLAVQVLPDGGHFERAPAYHGQVLGDLVDIAGLLSAAGEPGPPQLPAAITAMRRWLRAVLTPAGDVPLLNDGFPVSPELLAALLPAATGLPAATELPAEPAPAPALHVLPDTGLVTATAGRWHLLADVGLPCPRELPAHAHADTLGCLVHVDGEPLLVDTGTSSYAPGPVRQYQRSTAAHNTLEIDRADSTEVWGAFRAGRRARVAGRAAAVTSGAVTSDSASGTAASGTVTIEAAHDGYRYRPGRPSHHRSWRLSADELRIDDAVTGLGQHEIAVRWHLAPDTLLRLVPGGAVVTAKSGNVTVTVTAAGAGVPAAGISLTAAAADIAAGFGRTVSAPVLTGVLHCGLPVRISTVWRFAAAHPTPQEKPA
jgi:uncharacterized heparinase superfamily protein